MPTPLSVSQALRPGDRVNCSTQSLCPFLLLTCLTYLLSARQWHSSPCCSIASCQANIILSDWPVLSMVSCRALFPLLLVCCSCLDQQPCLSSVCNLPPALCTCHVCEALFPWGVCCCPDSHGEGVLAGLCLLCGAVLGMVA